MTLAHFFAFALGFFALFQYLFIPRLQRAIALDRQATRILSTARLSVFEVLRTATIVTAFSSGVLWLMLKGLGLRGQNTVSEVVSTLIVIARWQDQFANVSPWWSSIVSLTLGVGLAYAAYRHSRRHLEGVFNQLFEEELARLRREREDGKWEDLPPTEQMQAIDIQLTELEAALQSESTAASGEDSPESSSQPDRKAIERDYVRLAHIRDLLDVRRRMKPEIAANLDPYAAPMPPHKNLAERIGTLFISRGLLQTFKGTSKVLYIIGLLLLVPSLVAFQSPIMAGMLERKFVELDELKVNLSQKEAQKQLDDALKDPGKVAEPSSISDDKALDELAQSFEEWFASNVFPTRGTSAVISNIFTRQTILRNAVKSSGQALEYRGPAKESAALGQLSETEKAALTFAEHADDARGPRTTLGRQYRVELLQISREHPSAWARMKTSIPNLRSFQRAVPADHIARLLFSEVTGNLLFGGRYGMPDLAHAISDEIGKEALGHAYDTASRRFTADLAHGVPLNTVASASDGVHAWSAAKVEKLKAVTIPIPHDERLGELFANQSPSVELAPPRQSAHGAASTIMDDINHAKSSIRPEHTEALIEYEDVFPSHLGREQTTERGKLLAELSKHDPSQLMVPPAQDPSPASASGGGGGGGGGGGRGDGNGKPNTGAPTKAQHVSYQRSRSFTALRGFSRIGGVLIGREPTNGAKALDFSDISWRKVSATDIMISLARRDGKKFSLGPYRRGIVNVALVYAADGRPTTVTMITARPLRELKILLHPGLVDTPIGCRAIELDRFVDEFTGESTTRRDAERTVQLLNSLYQFAWAARVETLLGVIEREEKTADAADFVSMYRTAALRFRNENVRNATDALQLSGLAKAISDASTSPLRSHPGYFEPRLVEYMGQCAVTTSAPIERFANCIAEKTKNDLHAYFGGSRWQEPPSDFQIWSGVRERPYQLDSDLKFLERPAADSLWPFDFMLQTAFVSNRDDSEEELDADPWEFPLLKDEIQSAVAKGGAQTQHREILNDLREFAVLQRLFRVALSGNLGSNFPVTKLAHLAQDLEVPEKPSSDYRTMRWNVRPGLLELQFASALQSVDTGSIGSGSSEVPPLDKTIQLCLDLMRSASAKHTSTSRGTNWLQVLANSNMGQLALARISDDQWGRRCTFPSIEGYATGGDERAGQVARFVHQFAEETARARKMRRNLNVDADSVRLQQNSDTTCPRI